MIRYPWFKLGGVGMQPRGLVIRGLPTALFGTCESEEEREGSFCMDFYPITVAHESSKQYRTGLCRSR